MNQTKEIRPSLFLATAVIPKLHEVIHNNQSVMELEKLPDTWYRVMTFLLGRLNYLVKDSLEHPEGEASRNDFMGFYLIAKDECSLLEQAKNDILLSLAGKPIQDNPEQLATYLIITKQQHILENLLMLIEDIVHPFPHSLEPTL